MTFRKTKLTDLPFCYTVSPGRVDGRDVVYFAAESDGPCHAFDIQTFAGQTVWEHPGGTMGIIPIPDEDGDILAIQGFYPGFDAENSRLVRVTRKDGSWENTRLFDLGYLHRFDLLERNGQQYLLCCTVCSAKDSVDDWSSPGRLMVAKWNGDSNGDYSLVQLGEGMTRNHGYCRIQKNGYSAAWVSSDQGLFEVSPPEVPGKDWSIERLWDRPVSDIALCDIDNDGVDEVAMIEPFHGDSFRIYKPTDGGFEPIYEYPSKLAFTHAIWGGSSGAFRRSSAAAGGTTGNCLC